jgi:hypothetical protein
LPQTTLAALTLAEPLDRTMLRAKESRLLVEKGIGAGHHKWAICQRLQM